MYIGPYIKLLFRNAQGFNNKIDYMKVLYIRYNVDVIPVVEHWINETDAQFYCVPSYTATSFYGRPNVVRGGLAIIRGTW